MACIADTNVSQGCVAMHARCSGIFNIHLTQNLPTNFQWQKFFNRLRFDRIMVMSLWPRFFGSPCIYSCWLMQATKRAFHHFIQVDADSVWLVLNDTVCPRSPIPAPDNSLPPVHVRYLPLSLITGHAQGRKSGGVFGCLNSFRRKFNAQKCRL